MSGAVGWVAVLKYLRIAVTALSLTACMLLIALWVRSYWRFEQIIHRVSAADYVALSSIRGQIAFGGSNDPMLSIVFTRNWMQRGFSLKGWDINRGSPFAVFPVSTPRSIVLLPQFESPFVLGPLGSTSYELRLPYWLLVFASVAMGLRPWLPWRFSLRTLLITTTLVAVGLGVIVRSC